MQKEFERRIQLISPDLIIDAKPSSDLIFSILNEAQKRYVMQNYVGDDQMVAETNTHTKNTDSIKSLLVEKKITASSTTENGNARFLLPTGSTEKYFLYVHSMSTVTGTYKQYSTETKVNNQLIKYRDLPKFMQTAYNTPIVRTPAVALVSDAQTKQLYLEVAVDKYTNLKNIILTYYREPVEFNTISNTNQCELPESVHDEIVNLAVNMFITEGKYRLQAKQPEQKEQ
jgi:hypothetical protein